MSQAVSSVVAADTNSAEYTGESAERIRKTECKYRVVGMTTERPVTYCLPQQGSARMKEEIRIRLG